MKTINFERYARNLLLKEIGQEEQEKLINARVLVAGAGGLGSTVIANLASAGVGTLGIADGDTLELSNLNRQYVHKFNNIGKLKTESANEWINAYNPDINVNKYSSRLTQANSIDIIKEYDAIVDCFDSYKSKFELNKTCAKAGKPLVHAGVTEFSGQVMTVIPGKTACLHCLFNNPDPDAYVIKGILSPTVSLAASLQSSEVVKLLLSLDNKLMTNCLLSFNLLDNEFRKIKVEKSIKCPVCS